MTSRDGEDDQHKEGGRGGGEGQELDMDAGVYGGGRGGGGGDVVVAPWGVGL